MGRRRRRRGRCSLRAWWSSKGKEGGYYSDSDDLFYPPVRGYVDLPSSGTDVIIMASVG